MKYLYFLMGYTACLVTIFMASCTYAPLEASSNDCGDLYNPCYVKIID